MGKACYALHLPFHERALLCVLWCISMKEAYHLKLIEYTLSPRMIKKHQLTTWLNTHGGFQIKIKDKEVIKHPSFMARTGKHWSRLLKKYKSFAVKAAWKNLATRENGGVTTKTTSLPKKASNKQDLIFHVVYALFERIPPPPHERLHHSITLQWCHNGRDSFSNHQPHHCLLNRLFRRRSNKTWKLHVTGLCAGNSPATGEFPAQMASYAENGSIWWHHPVCDLNAVLRVMWS